MTENSPPPAARTPGDVAWAAFCENSAGLPVYAERWESKPGFTRDAWEAAARAAIAAAPAGPENSWAEAFHDDAAEARAEVLRLRERIGELEAANAALVLAEPDDSQAAETAGMRSALREICNAMQQYDDGRASAVEAIDMIDATLSDHGAKS